MNAKGGVRPRPEQFHLYQKFHGQLVWLTINPVMYQPHKGAVGITSVYQIGIGSLEVVSQAREGNVRLTCFGRDEVVSGHRPTVDVNGLPRGKWSVITGGMAQPIGSTYDFMRDVRYDLAAFFERNSGTLREEINTTLKTLLATETR